MQKIHQLIIREPSREPWVYTVEKDYVKIGRSSQCSVKIKDPRISREHCLIQMKNNVLRIQDLDSRNGFSVNGIPEKDTQLKPNDRISIGLTSLNYIIKDELQDDIEITSEEPNETFSFTLDLLANDDEVTSNGKLINFFNNLLNIVDDKEDLNELAEAILNELIENSPVTDCAIAIYNKTEKKLIDEYKRSDLKLKIPKKMLTKIFDNNEAFHLQGDDTKNDKSKLLLPLFQNNELSCILILLIDESKLENDLELQSLFTLTGKLISVVLKNHMKLDQISEQIAEKNRIDNEFNIVGNSTPMKKVYDLIRKVGPVDITILITGDSGTGKELVAKAIHGISLRKDKPFVSINCGAIPINLIESELFGHEKGAFTGAIKTHLGCFERADGGILFFDEIGELDPNVQVKLLRSLETRTIRRVGGDKDIPVDIRVLAATHRDLEQMVKENLFREDLFFRLQVIEINLPPLSKRTDDIELIADYYLNKLSNDMGRNIPQLSPSAIDILKQYNWPGNIRELKNALERSIVLNTSDNIGPEFFEHLRSKTQQIPMMENMAISEDDVNPLKDIEKAYIFKVLDIVSGNKQKAAKLLGIERKTLYNKLSQYEKNG
ncbi:MAG: hypothetical protein COA79_23715 [Planctomycetota bacterium]|nr:MAG: hypothetical protein COA79_23715 [Planctomycetota bacterium]